MTADRTILHCDCNGYYASVECLFRPELREVPMAVCGDPDSRHGIILAKNELAKRYGVVTAETIWQAKRKCPELTLVAPHHDAYSRISKQINEIYGQYTDRVEAFSIDESWLDVTGSLHLFGTGRQIADELRRRIREEIGVTISVGVSFNKVFAKLGSDYKKPDATTEITRENYRDILFPLPVRDMIFIGHRAAETLQKVGIKTIGDLAGTEMEKLTALLGKAGQTMWRYANGLDDAPVLRPDEQEAAKSIGNGITFAHNLETEQDVRAGILALADTVGRRLRRHKVKCTVVQLQIKDPDLKVISRQRSLERPTDLSGEIAREAMELLHEAWPKGKPIRMMSVTGAGLVGEGAAEQLNLFDSGEDRARRGQLEQALDAIEGRFGRGTVRRGSLLNSDIISDRKRPGEDR